MLSWITRPGYGVPPLLTALLTLAGAALAVAAAWLLTTPVIPNAQATLAVVAAAAVLPVVAISRPLWLFPVVAMLSTVIISVQFAGANLILADPVVGILALVWCLFRRSQPWDLPANARQIMLPVVLLLAISILSLSYSQDFSFGLTKVIQLSEYLIFLLLTVAMLRDLRWMYGTLVAYVAACTLAALAEIAYLAIYHSSLGAGNILFYQKNGLGLFLVLGLTIVTAVLLFRQPSGTQRLAWWAAGFVLAAGEILTSARGAWVAYAVALLVLALPRGRGFVIRLVFVTVVLLVAANAVLPQDLLRTQQLAPSVLFSPSATLRTGGSALVRLVVWRDALRIIAAHPLRGVGVGGYISYDAYQGDSQDFNTNDPHDAILYEWAELGPVGLLIFLWLVVNILRVSWRAYRGAAMADARCLGAAVLASLVAYLVVSLSQPFWTRGDGLVFFMLVGMAVNLVAHSSTASLQRPAATTESRATPLAVSAR